MKKWYYVHIILSSVFISAGHILPVVFVLLSEHSALRTASRDPCGHASVPAGVPEEARPQTAPCCIFAQTSTKDHQVSTSLKGSVKVTFFVFLSDFFHTHTFLSSLYIFVQQLAEKTVSQFANICMFLLVSFMYLFLCPRPPFGDCDPKYLLHLIIVKSEYPPRKKTIFRFSDTGTCSRELQKALDCMLVVLKCVNDSMHQIAITGFPVSRALFQRATICVRPCPPTGSGFRLVPSPLSPFPSSCNSPINYMYSCCQWTDDDRNWLSSTAYQGPP